MEWYKTLDIHTRINMKECFYLACGIKFEDLSFIFSFRDRINILYKKLLYEGLIN